MGQRFIWVVFFFTNAIRSGAIQRMLLSNIRCKDLLDALLRLEWSRRNIKTSSPNRCSGIFLVESIEGWLKKQDKTSKQTSDHQTNQSGRSKRSLHESQGEPRGERDVIRLRNPTEDKRAFRVLTFSRSPSNPFLSLSRSVRRVGENPGNEVAPENRKKYCGVGLWRRENHPSVCVKIYFIELSTGNFNMHGFAVYIHVLKKVSHDWNGA